MVGAGNRGYLAYGAYAERHPDKARFVAVVEPDEGRRARFGEAHRIPADRRFSSWEELAARPQVAPALVNATMAVPTVRARSLSSRRVTRSSSRSRSRQRPRNACRSLKPRKTAAAYFRSR